MNLSSNLILAANSIIDGKGTISSTNNVRERLLETKAKVQEFKISSIKDGWGTPLPKNTVRGACSSISVMIESQRLFEKREVDAVIISGKDHIRSDFRNNKEERDQLMKVYEGKYSFLEAYNQLAHEFLRYWKIQPEEFRSLAAALFENHFGVLKNSNPTVEPPDKKWFEPVTDLFRGVDCANPNVDFEGCLIFGTTEIAKRCGIDPKDCVQIVGCNLKQVGEDSLSSIPKIVNWFGRIDGRYSKILKKISHRRDRWT